MRIMVTGATGQLGQDTVEALRRRGHEVLGVSSRDFDLTDPAAIAEAVAAAQPEAIIHCAAYTAVDRAESDMDRCMAINAAGTMHLARAARKAGAKLLYISTDYIFDGSGDTPWETDARPAPLNVYGLSKWQGEEAVRALLERSFILRVSWVFGTGGSNFVRTMLRLGRERTLLRVVDDQRGAPAYTRDLAELIADMIVTDRYGVYHAANEGCCSFAEFATAILSGAGLPCRVEPIPTSQYPTAARRPLNSRLSTRCLTDAGFSRLPIWENALTRFLTELRDRGEL